MREGYTYLASVFGFLGLGVCVAGLAIGASLLWRADRRASSFLWAATATFLLRGVSSVVINLVLFRIFEVEHAMVLMWGFDAAFTIIAWLLITGALVMLARTLREPGRTAPRSNPAL